MEKFDYFMEQAFDSEVIQKDLGQAAAAYDFKPADLGPERKKLNIYIFNNH
jgi:hypothetical protein